MRTFAYLEHVDKRLWQSTEGKLHLGKDYKECHLLRMKTFYGIEPTKDRRERSGGRQRLLPIDCKMPEGNEGN